MTAPLWLLLLVGVGGPVVGATAVVGFFIWYFRDKR